MRESVQCTTSTIIFITWCDYRYLCIYTSCLELTLKLSGLSLSSHTHLLSSGVYREMKTVAERVLSNITATREGDKTRKTESQDNLTLPTFCLHWPGQPDLSDISSFFLIFLQDCVSFLAFSLVFLPVIAEIGLTHWGANQVPII